MHIGKTITMLCLSSGALSFKICAFSGDGCTGGAREINVFDNTCRNTDVPTTRSFRVLAYGAARQRAGFSRSGVCVNDGGEGSKTWWADGGSDVFIKGACVNLGYAARAYNSISA